MSDTFRQSIHTALLRKLRDLTDGEANVLDRSAKRPYTGMVILGNLMVNTRIVAYGNSIDIACHAKFLHPQGAISGMVFANEWNRTRRYVGAVFVDTNNYVTYRTVHEMHSIVRGMNPEALDAWITGAATSIVECFTAWDASVSELLGSAG